MSVHSSIAKTAAETELALAFGGLPAPSEARSRAFAAFAKLGLPTRRVEAWHYTDLRGAMRHVAPLATTPDADSVALAREALAGFARIGEIRFVLLNGHFVPELSDLPPEGLGIATIPEPALLARGEAPVLLNEAFAPAALSLVVAEGTQLAGPIEIANIVSAGAPRAVYSRVVARLHERANATFVETFVGAGPGAQRNAVTQISLDAGARCEWATLIDDAPELHLETQFVSVGRDAEFNGFALVPGGDFVRRQIFAKHSDPSAKLSFSGLSLLDGERLADTTLEITHGAPHGKSREFFRHIVADEAVGIYQGKVVVEQYAQKTDGGMKSQAILLSPTAVMNNKPELEIFADDVVCGHGATVGALDPAQIFYLEARGIPKTEAEAMLLQAFGVEAIEKLADPDLIVAAAHRAQAWLSARGTRG